MGKQHVLEKTIAGAARLLEDTFLGERLAERDGLLQGIEPRCKVAGVLALILAVSFLRSPAAVWGAALLTLPLAAASRIGIGFFTRRVLLLGPLFSLVVVLPAAFSILSPGENLWTVATLSREIRLGPWTVPAEIALTREGARTVLLITGRVAASVSLALLLTLTTRWDRLFRGLRGLGVPSLFVFVAATARRYLFHLLAVGEEMHVARKSRTIRYGSTRQEQEWAAGRIGHLFRRSLHDASGVHEAMLARGFSGDLKGLKPYSPAPADRAFLAGSLALALALVAIDRLC